MLAWRLPGVFVLKHFIKLVITSRMGEFSAGVSAPLGAPQGLLIVVARSTTFKFVELSSIRWSFRMFPVLLSPH